MSTPKRLVTHSRTKPRTSGAQLPSADELMAILAHESQRLAIRLDYVTQNPSIHAKYRELATLAGADVSWIDDYESTEFYKLAADIIDTQDVIAAFVADNQNLHELYKGVYEGLIPAQDESPSELLFVFGAASDARINRAVELYKQGVAPKMLLSGNRPYYSENPVSEAERMRDIALAAGVPADAILIEPESITVPDNVKRSIDLLDYLGWHPTSVTIIATNFVLQRARMEWYKYADWDVNVKPVAARTISEKFTAAHWFTDEQVTMLVLNEYAKLIMESKIEGMRVAGEL